MAYKELKTRIKWCRDTSANWTSNNPVLLDGEIIVVDTDSGETRFKIGDGVKTYTQLPFEDEAVRNLINNKVDKVDGKGLSTNDYTTDEKNKLAEIEDAVQYIAQVRTEEEKAIARENIGAGVPQIQVDWNQADETKIDYIKNKPEEFTSDDALEYLISKNIITPVASSSGQIYTSIDGKILLI